MTRNGQTYEYIRYENRYTYPWQYYVDNLISAFISQDVNKEYAFVVNYRCNLITADALICVYQPGRTKMIAFGCVLASAQAVLSSLRPQECEPVELTESQKLKYFADGYITPGYV